MTPCSRCGCTEPNIECSVCWEEPAATKRDAYQEWSDDNLFTEPLEHSYACPLSRRSGAYLNPQPDKTPDEP